MITPLCDFDLSIETCPMMKTFQRLVLSVLAVLSAASVQAQIALSEVPIVSCAGNVISGTATYTTSLTLETGTSQRIPAGDFCKFLMVIRALLSSLIIQNLLKSRVLIWSLKDNMLVASKVMLIIDILLGDQFGAVWVFSTDTTGVRFGFAGIPGVGAGSEDIPQAAQDAITIDPSGTAWTLTVPSPTVGEFDIVFGIGTASAPFAVSQTTTAATWTKGACTITYDLILSSFDTRL